MYILYEIFLEFFSKFFLEEVEFLHLLQENSGSFKSSFPYDKIICYTNEGQCHQTEGQGEWRGNKMVVKSGWNKVVI